MMPKNIYKIFPEIIYPIYYPDNETEVSLFNYLKGFCSDNENRSEFENYLKEDLKRFVYTWNLLDKNKSGKLLEIGADPYFISIILKKFTKYDLFFTNYFGSNDGEITRHFKKNSESNETFEFTYLNHNIEYEDIPFDEKFDIVLFCEVLEHLTIDPLKAISRIKKSMKENGVLILTTPNVNRLENVAKMIAGVNIYDPYSGYGVYGRHNREYNKHELFMLLTHCGFEIEIMFSSDVHENFTNGYVELSKFSKLIKYRKDDLGQYIFIRARNVFPEKTCKPNWLYRSYPKGILCD